MNISKKTSLLLTSFIFLFVSCNQDDRIKEIKKDIEIIKAFDTIETIKLSDTIETIKLSHQSLLPINYIPINNIEFIEQNKALILPQNAEPLNSQTNAYYLLSLPKTAENKKTIEKWQSTTSKQDYILIYKDEINQQNAKLQALNQALSQQNLKLKTLNQALDQHNQKIQGLNEKLKKTSTESSSLLFMLLSIGLILGVFIFLKLKNQKKYSQVREISVETISNTDEVQSINSKETVNKEIPKLSKVTVKALIRNKDLFKAKNLLPKNINKVGDLRQLFEYFEKYKISSDEHHNYMSETEFMSALNDLSTESEQLCFLMIEISFKEKMSEKILSYSNKGLFISKISGSFNQFHLIDLKEYQTTDFHQFD